MISPNQMESLATEIRRLYSDAEVEILALIAERLAAGIESPRWAELKLAELRRLIELIDKILGKLAADVPVTLEEILAQTYAAGAASAEADLRALGVAGDSASFGAVNTRAVSALVGKTLGLITNTHTQILRNSQDIYRKVIAETATRGVVGTQTRRQVAQQALNRFAAKGIGGFTDKAGREWDLASYVEMSTRSAIGQAAVNGHLDRMESNGRDLVIVSDHPEECALCRPWEGKILSISGLSGNYPAVSTARGAGLFHPGCGHTLGAYIEGLTKIEHPKPDPSGYDERMTQRYMERQIREWKRRQAVAITDDDKRKAGVKVREWQAKIRQFVEDNDRRRKYEREAINGTAR